MKFLKILLLLSTTQFLQAQTILPKFPEGQSPYKDGTIQMFQDIQNILLQNQENTCEPTQIIWITLKIQENGQPILIKKQSQQKDYQQNQCAFNAITKALVKLNKWQPATLNNKPVQAYFTFPFIPNHFYNNFKNSYNPSTLAVAPSFPGGEKEFRNQVVKHTTGYISTSSQIPYGVYTFSLEIDENGKVQDIDIEPKVPNSALFFQELKYGIKKIKTPWQPGYLNGQKAKMTYRFSIDFLEI